MLLFDSWATSAHFWTATAHSSRLKTVLTFKKVDFGQGKNPDRRRDFIGLLAAPQ
jgi:hypothetical protein